MANRNDKPKQAKRLVKPHILLIGLVLVAFNSYWCLMGTEVWHSTQLTIASLFFNAVFYPPRFRTDQPTVPTICAPSGDVASRFANYLCDGSNANDNQRTHDDGLSYSRPRTRLPVRNARK